MRRMHSRVGRRRRQPMPSARGSRGVRDPSASKRPKRRQTDALEPSPRRPNPRPAAAGGGSKPLVVARSRLWQAHEHPMNGPVRVAGCARRWRWQGSQAFDAPAAPRQRAIPLKELARRRLPNGGSARRTPAHALAHPLTPSHAHSRPQKQVASRHHTDRITSPQDASGIYLDLGAPPGPSAASQPALGDHTL